MLYNINMQHTVEKKRKMRNARKKRKRLKKTELKCSMLIENPLPDAHAKVGQAKRHGIQIL